MRHAWLALAVLLLAGGAVQGQQQQPPVAAPAPAPLDPQNNRLDFLLLQWEAKMKEVDTLSAEVVREKDDRAFRVREIYEGQARYKKPNLALLELHRKDRPAVFEKFICTGSFLYEFNQDNKELRIHELPPPKPGQVSDDSFLSFLFGMRAEEAKRRYDMKLFKEDKNYVYLEILPKLPADKADFQKAYLALAQNTFLPRVLIFDEPNGNRVKWDIPMIDSGVKLDPREFTSPQLPAGWKAVRAPKVNEPQPAQGNDPPPRVVRPKS